MGALIPDTGLRGPERVIWVDAKYKATSLCFRSMGGAVSRKPSATLTELICIRRLLTRPSPMLPVLTPSWPIPS
jgi:hypothetical protein